MESKVVKSKVVKSKTKTRLLYGFGLYDFRLYDFTTQETDLTTSQNQFVLSTLLESVPIWIFNDSARTDAQPGPGAVSLRVLCVWGRCPVLIVFWAPTTTAQHTQ